MKKLFCLMLAVCMMFTLAACGGSEEKAADADTPKSEQEGTAGSNIALKDNPEEAEKLIKDAVMDLIEETYGDKVDDAKVEVQKIYSAEDEQNDEILKTYNLGPDEVAFEIKYELHPTEGTDVNELMAATGEYDEESGWIKEKFNLGVLRPKDDGTYEITNFGTGW